MGRASRAKRERREAPVPHYEIRAGIASASGGAGSEQEKTATEEES